MRTRLHSKGDYKWWCRLYQDRISPVPNQGAKIDFTADVGLAPEVASQALRVALDAALAKRPSGDRPRRTCAQCPFAAHEVVACLDGAEAFQNKLLRLLFEECWTFPSIGVCVPEDAHCWSENELRVFVQSGGHIKPRRRWHFGAPCNPCLEEAWHAADFSDRLQAHVDFEELKSEYPRVIWSYWAQGAERLPRFRRLCALSWIIQNPGWRFVLLDAERVGNVIWPEDLPENWVRLGPEHAADAVRLALLARYGGVWTDVGNLCLKPLEDWIWRDVHSCGRGFGAFYYAHHGAVPGESREYVENWFLAARRSHPFVVAWHACFLEAWRGKLQCEEVHRDPMFDGLEFPHLDTNQRRYLTMHLTFAKLVQEDPELRRIWDEEMVLLRADDHVLRWMAGIGFREEALRLWVYELDEEWIAGLAAGAPLVKFIGKFARALDAQPMQHLIRRKNNIQRLLLSALSRGGPAEGIGGDGFDSGPEYVAAD